MGREVWGERLGEREMRFEVVDLIYGMHESVRSVFWMRFACLRTSIVVSPPNQACISIHRVYAFAHALGKASPGC